MCLCTTYVSTLLRLLIHLSIPETFTYLGNLYTLSTSTNSCFPRRITYLYMEIKLLSTVHDMVRFTSSHLRSLTVCPYWTCIARSLMTWLLCGSRRNDNCLFNGTLCRIGYGSESGQAQARPRYHLVSLVASRFDLMSPTTPLLDHCCTLTRLTFRSIDLKQSNLNCNAVLVLFLIDNSTKYTQQCTYAT